MSGFKKVFKRKGLITFFNKEKNYYLTIRKRDNKVYYYCDCMCFALYTEKKRCKHIKECIKLLNIKRVSDFK